MATTTQVQTVREAPEIEAFKVGLYSDALNYIKAMQGLNPDGTPIMVRDPSTGELIEAGPVLPPTQAIAGMTADQLGAGELIRTGIGG